MTESVGNSESDSFDLKDFVENNYWKIRECADYYDEYKECKSFGARFHQYFVNGEFTDCSPWKDDYKNCEASITDIKAAARVIHHEEERRQRRLNLHNANNVWKRREKPPPDWEKELPSYLQENQKNSFEIADQKSNCIIS